MKYLGTIKPSGDLDHDSWIALIASDSDLIAPESRTGTNPFTKEPQEFAPPPTSAIVILDGAKAGSISLSQDGADELSVFGETERPADVIAVAERVAQHLSASFEPWTS